MNQDTKIYSSGNTPEYDDEMNEVGRVNLLSLYKSFLLHTQIPQHAVDILNNYTDSLKESKNKNYITIRISKSCQKPRACTLTKI